MLNQLSCMTTFGVGCTQIQAQNVAMWGTGRVIPVTRCCEALIVVVFVPAHGPCLKRGNDLDGLWSSICCN